MSANIQLYLKLKHLMFNFLESNPEPNRILINRVEIIIDKIQYINQMKN